MREEYLHNHPEIYSDYQKLYLANNGHLSRDNLRSIDSKLFYQIRKYFNSYSNFKFAFDKWNENNKSYEHFDVNDSYNNLQKQNIKLQNKNNELKYQRDLLLKQITSQEELYNNIINNLPVITYNKCNFVDKNIEKKKGTAILHLSDLHYGEVVQFGDVVYDCAIAENNLSSIISQFCFKVHEYNKAVILCNGDMLNGVIHEVEFGRTNELTTIETILRLSKILTESFILVYEHMQKPQKLDIVFTVGNHSRTIPGGVYYKNKVKENWEYLLGEMVKKELSYTCPNINVVVSNTPSIVYEIENLRFAITHGDCFKSLNNIRMGVAKFQEMNMSTIGKFDHIIIGHFHQFQVLPILGGLLFVNGTTKCCDEYSTHNLYSIVPPSQTCICVEDNNITDIIPLFCHNV